ncbi:MAG: DegV family protein [Clostridia bacterium]|nr:DegV family protein [Clostridia bacterium]MBQ9919556.1 DegV family protein [Clostridia bacterium]
MSKKKIQICSDSSCDLGTALCERYDVILNPFRITLGDESLIDGVEVTPDDLYAFHERTGTLPKTSATNMAEHMEFFEKQLENAEEILFFTISSTMSVNNHAANLAAEEFDNVYVIDSANLSTGVGLLIIAAAEMAEKGLSAAEIKEKIEALKTKVNASFVIDSLEYLHKGGRCSAVAALGANLLKLKPCIEVKNGSMGVSKKYRGKYSEVLKTYALERLENLDNIVTDHVFVTHAGCDSEIVDSIVDIVKEKLNPKELHITRAGATVSVHCGRNTLGVLFLQKTDVE